MTSSADSPGWLRYLPASRGLAVPVAVETVEHCPHRPSWLCLVEGEPWPCGAARVELAEAYGPDRAGLAVYLAVLLGFAACEAGPVLAVELHERFIAWVRVETPPINHPLGVDYF